MLRRIFIFMAVLVALPCFGQNGIGSNCTIAGTWYGGSVVGYQLTVTPSTPAGHYTFIFQGMYATVDPNNGEPVLAAHPTGELVKKGNAYEGSMLSLGGDNKPPMALTRMPDFEVGWVSMELLDCNTIKNTIPFFGIYFGVDIWSAGTPWTGPSWAPNPKALLNSEPDVDLIPILTGDVKPIVEIYRRVPTTVNLNLAAFHK